MAYDPVRESSQSSASPVLSNRQSISSILNEERSDEAIGGHDDFSYTRRPSRSASLVDILNPSNKDPTERPSSSTSSSAQLNSSSDQQQGSWTSVETTVRGRSSPRFSYDIVRDQPSHSVGRGRDERSPSLRLSSMMNPSPGSAATYTGSDHRSNSRPGSGNWSRERAGRGSPRGDSHRGGFRSRENSLEVAQEYHSQAERNSSLRVQGRVASHGSAGGSPLMNSGLSGSPLETSPMGHPTILAGPHQYYGYGSVESPRSTSSTHLPHTSILSPQSSYSALQMAPGPQSQRSVDGFRIPSLPSHRSPEMKRSALPSIIPSPPTSINNGSNDTYSTAREGAAYPMTPNLTSGSPTVAGSGAYGTVSAGAEYFGNRFSTGLPITPGGREMMSPITPGSQTIADRSRNNIAVTPGSASSYNNDSSRRPASLSESNMNDVDHDVAPPRLQHLSRMSVDGLLGTARNASPEARRTSITISDVEERQPSLSETRTSVERDIPATKRARSGQDVAAGQKRLKGEEPHSQTDGHQVEEAGASQETTPKSVIVEDAPADGNGTDTRNVSGSLTFNSEADRPLKKMKSNALPKLDVLSKNEAAVRKDVGTSATEAANSQLEFAEASLKGESQNEGSSSTSLNSAMQPTGGKVKLIDSEEMDRLTSRDSKKRKISSAMGPTPEPPKLGKTEKTVPSSLPRRPSFTNGSIDHDNSSSLPASATRGRADSAATEESLPVTEGPLPYRPTKRVSAPDSIRRPLSHQDLISLHDTIEARGANTLRRKWRDHERAEGRDGADGFEEVLRSWGKKPTGNDTFGYAMSTSSTVSLAESAVAQHYNNRQELGLQARRFSPILPLKNFNNWVKSILIGSFGRRGGKALDMGGGKGGDLQKWDKLGVRELVLADIAATSVDQARDRYMERNFRWKASFYAFDCFGEPLAGNMPPEALDPPFDTVSLQFCMHYGWETLQKARLVIENISRYLEKGGVFIGTIPNSEELYRRRDSMPPDELSFGNEKYRVRFEQREKRKPFGDRYTFFLDDAVDEVPEFVVDWDQFESLAKECGLSLIFKKPMDQVWEEYRFQPEYENLARRMKVCPNPRGSSQPMDDDLWEATTIYLAFAFEKSR